MHNCIIDIIYYCYLYHIITVFTVTQQEVIFQGGITFKLKNEFKIKGTKTPKTQYNLLLLNRPIDKSQFKRLRFLCY